KIHYKELANRVDYFKGKEQGVSAMCDLMENFLAKREAKALEEGRVEGRIEGLETGRIIIARKMLREDFDLEAISRMTELPLDEVRRLSLDCEENHKRKSDYHNV
ncbi:MAG: hypothetical protein IJ934_07620, partial [Acetobacter sp.]|nr:hypothetical protein [Acetobacter sp.]